MALAGIRADSAPYLNSKFLNEKSVLTDKPIDLHFLEPQSLRRLDAMTAKPLANAVLAAELEVLSPQSLVRFFEPKKNVTPASNTISTRFQVPIKPTAEPAPAAKPAEH